MVSLWILCYNVITLYANTYLQETNIWGGFYLWQSHFWPLLSLFWFSHISITRKTQRQLSKLQKLIWVIWLQLLQKTTSSFWFGHILLNVSKFFENKKILAEVFCGDLLILNWFRLYEYPEDCGNQWHQRDRPLHSVRNRYIFHNQYVPDCL